MEDLEITREVECIDFEIGDNVVYPHHGAGKVVKKEEKNILGEVRQYLTIKILHNDMTVMVPCENAGKAGLRRVIDEETVQDRKSTRLNSSHANISYAVFCLKKKNTN